MGLTSKKDYLLRMVDEMTAVLAAVLGLRKAGHPEEALAKLTAAGGDILGTPRSVLDVLSASSAARLLGEPAKVRAYGRMLRMEAEILVDLGRDGLASRRRSAQLVIEASRMPGGMRAEDKAELIALGDVDLDESDAADVRRILDNAPR
jgi:hypothetical protein